MNVKDATPVSDTIREYIRDSFFREDEAPGLHNHDDLMEILDSLQILRMVADLASRFSIVIDNSDLTPENFGSVEKIAEFVARKQQG